MLLSSINSFPVSGRLLTLWSSSLSLFPVSISGALRYCALHTRITWSANHRSQFQGYVSKPSYYQISFPSSYRVSISLSRAAVEKSSLASLQPHEPSGEAPLRPSPRVSLRNPTVPLPVRFDINDQSPCPGDGWERGGTGGGGRSYE